MTPQDTGAYSYAAAHANIGVTMGGFVCLALFGEKGLALSLIYLTLWTMLMFGVFFPLAGAFAGQTVRFGTRSFLRLAAGHPVHFAAGDPAGPGTEPRRAWIGRAGSSTGTWSTCWSASTTP